jgi:hypothetical protein
MQSNPQTAAIIPFPKGVMKGRKRLARSPFNGAGDLSLLAQFDENGIRRPFNVVSLKDVEADAEAENVESGDMALLIASTIFSNLPEAVRETLKANLALSSVTGKAAFQRALCKRARDWLGPRFYVEYPEGGRIEIEGGEL